MIILLHSSKTMRQPAAPPAVTHKPQLLSRATQLASYLQTLSDSQIAATMHISAKLAAATQARIAAWNTVPAKQSLAIDSFVGDIYSGLQASDLSADDRDYADTTLRILSGLYGILRPYDGICPYRLEMGYRLPDQPYTNLYNYWGRAIAGCLPSTGPIINVSSLEYTKTITPFVDPDRVITPQFLTLDPKTGQPTFVVVHAKIARGAYARWLITSRTTNPADLTAFSDIGYLYDTAQSTAAQPTFVCETFLGKGLSMRLADI
jgi:cytoplasmic iron level regulating protein YaaA (DUF328/UPF0246 family)